LCRWRRSASDGYSGLILAHTTLGVAFVVITVLATLSGFDRTLIRAAESLGASPITTFRRVTMVRQDGRGRAGLDGMDCGLTPTAGEHASLPIS
jgi:ABC-type methionine transport system permease subunit